MVGDRFAHAHPEVYRIAHEEGRMLPANFPSWVVQQLAKRRLVTDIRERVQVERLTCGEATIVWEKRPRDTTACIAIKNINEATDAVNVRLVIASTF